MAYDANVSADIYIKQLEEKHQGTISNRFLSLFYGDTAKNIREHGVFMYQIGSTLFFEDFEYKSAILGIKVESREPYVKFEGSIDIKDIESVTKVSKGRALRYCKGKTKKTGRRGIFNFLFGETVLMLNFKSREPVFIQVPLKLINNVINSVKEQ